MDVLRDDLRAGRVVEAARWLVETERRAYDRLLRDVVELLENGDIPRDFRSWMPAMCAIARLARQGEHARARSLLQKLMALRDSLDGGQYDLPWLLAQMRGVDEASFQQLAEITEARRGYRIPRDRGTPWPPPHFSELRAENRVRENSAELYLGDKQEEVQRMFEQADDSDTQLYLLQGMMAAARDASNAWILETLPPTMARVLMLRDAESTEMLIISALSLYGYRAEAEAACRASRHDRRGWLCTGPSQDPTVSDAEVQAGGFGVEFLQRLALGGRRETAVDRLQPIQPLYAVNWCAFVGVIEPPRAPDVISILAEFR